MSSKYPDDCELGFNLNGMVMIVGLILIVVIFILVGNSGDLRDGTHYPSQEHINNSGVLSGTRRKN